jgi:hypothetical protein
MNNMVEKDGLMKKRTELLPEVTTFPRIDKVQFSLPERPNSRYDNKNPIPKNLKFVNELDKDGLDKKNTKIRVFDADYLNQVNTKRLDDLRTIDPKTEAHRDVLTEYLDRETTASKIRLHDEDIKNELLNQDLLYDYELPHTKDYQTPLKVIEKYRDFPSLDQLTV